MPNTVSLQRVLAAPAEKVFCAFVDPDALVKWIPPQGSTGKMHGFDFRVGGGGIKDKQSPYLTFSVSIRGAYFRLLAR